MDHLGAGPDDSGTRRLHFGKISWLKTATQPRLPISRPSTTGRVARPLVNSCRHKKESGCPILAFFARVAAMPFGQHPQLPFDGWRAAVSRDGGTFLHFQLRWRDNYEQTRQNRGHLTYHTT